MKLGQAIKIRKSVRKFSSKRPDWRDLLEAIDSAKYAPMTGNLFPLKFIVVNDEKVIKKLAKSAEQPFINEAQYVVVVCSNASRIVDMYGKRGEIYSRQQSGAAIQNFLLSLEEKGLSTCWIGHFVETQVKRVLKIKKKEVVVEAFFPIGYEHAQNREKRKRKNDLDAFLYFDEWEKKRMKN